MNARLERLLTVGRTVGDVMRSRDITVFAASIAYYAFVSIVPLLVVSVVVGTFVGGPALASTIAEMVGAFLLPTGQELVSAALMNTTGRGGVTVFGLLLFSWSGLKLFRGLDVAFSRVYGSASGSLVSQLVDGVVVAGSMAVSVAAVVVVTAALALFRLPFLGVLGPLALLAVLAAAFFPVYYIFPDTDVTVREVLPGTLVAAVGWTVLGILFGVYAAFASTTGALALYGVLGAMLLLVTWFYLAGLLVLVGAVVNAVLAGRVDRQVQQESGPEFRTMHDRDDERPRSEPRGAPDIAELDDRVTNLRADLDDFETDIRERTVEKPTLEADLKRYVRARMRRGHARGWGPYLVLLYGTVMTLGAFYFLDGGWAILAMIVLFLSTLGLYVLFVLVGLGLNLVSVPGRAADAVRKRR